MEIKILCILHPPATSCYSIAFDCMDLAIKNFLETSTKLHSSVCSFPELHYSSSNWTVSTLPSTSRVVNYTRHLRSTSLKDQQGRIHRYGPRKYFCPDCNRTFALMASLTRHRIYECDKRALKSTQEAALDRKNKKKYVCKDCNRVYAVFTSLWRHRNYECGVEPRFICSVCNLRFSQKSNLDRHMRTKH